jgi:hypothetical protein
MRSMSELIIGFPVLAVAAFGTGLSTMVYSEQRTLALEVSSVAVALALIVE